MLIASLLTFFVVVFLLATLTMAIAWLAFLKRQTEAREAAVETLDGIPQDSAEPILLDNDTGILREDRLSTLGFWDSLLTHFDFVEILKKHLSQADLLWSVGRVTIAMLLLGTVGFLLFHWFLPVFASFLGAAILASAPYVYILQRRNKRFEKFRENFPDVLDSLARAMRAGYPLSPAMEAVIAESTPVIAVELRKASTEANLGLGWQRALENLGQRMPLLEVNLFVAAVQLHSRTGGKLSEVLAGLAENMREVGSLRGEVRALAAYGKLSGVILTILPLGIAAMMMMVSPTYIVTLWRHPYGQNLIAAAAGCLVLAHFVIRKIVDIEI
jgi:tight adherence protein B